MMSNEEPGGNAPGQHDNPDFSGLQNNFNQQQAKITALKELVRGSDSKQQKVKDIEKVKNIAQTLKALKTKASRSRQLSSVSMERFDERIPNILEEEALDTSLPVQRRSETPRASEKFHILRKQIEEKRLLMERRENQNKEIQQRVDQMRSDFENSQMSLEKSLEFGRSVGDLTLVSPLKGREFMSVADMSEVAHTMPNFSVERMKFLEARVKQLERDMKATESEQVQALQSQILDLQENLKEKECVIEARTQAVSLMSQNMSLKGKNTVDLLEETKQEMMKMQTNFLNAEEDLKKEISRLQIELEEKTSDIANLEEVNNILETARYDLTIENADLKAKLSDVAEYSTKIGELNKLNQTLQHRIADLEQQKYEFITDDEAQQARQHENPETQAKIDELEQQNADLQKTIDEFVSDAEVQRKVGQLEQIIEAQKQELAVHGEEMAAVQESLQEKTVELNVLNANFSVLQEKLKQTAPKSLFPATDNEEGQQEIAKLKQQLDESNKSMIKSKLKIKQLQKQIDSFKKTSNVHQEVSRLTEENQTMRQKLVELEEEKGNLQLHLVNFDGSVANVPHSELEQKVKFLETTCQNQTNAIQLLEEQKIEVTEDLNNTRSELTILKDQIGGNAEGEVAESSASGEIDRLKSLVAELEDRCHTLDEEKKLLDDKLDHYITENIELLGKVEKLTSKGSSSAESIEIVENLTQQQKEEIAEFEKNLDVKDEIPSGGRSDDGDTKKDDFGNDLNDGFAKLQEEMIHKIELFETERREVLEKLEAIKLENLSYAKQVEALESERKAYKEANEQLDKEKVKLAEMLEKAEHDKQQLQIVLKEFQENKTKIKEVAAELKRTISVEEVVEVTSAALSSAESSPSRSMPATIDRETYERAMTELDAAIQNFQKNKDKNAKLRLSKKLQSEAKNTHTMMGTFMEAYWRNVAECEKLHAELQAVRHNTTATGGADNETVMRLEKDLTENLEKLAAKDANIERLLTHIKELENELALQKTDFDNRVSDALNELKSDLSGLLEQIASKDKEISKLNGDNHILTDAAEDLQKLQAELTARIEVSTNEIAILKDLVAEQKAQLIATFEEHETETAAKLQTITELENAIEKLKAELEMVQANTDADTAHQNELKLLQELRTENESQIGQLTEEIGQKQATIETLNQQIIDLYRQMEENSNRLIEREDEIQYLQEIIDANKGEVKKLSVQLGDRQREIADLEERLSKVSAELEKVKQVPAPSLESVQALGKLKELESQNHDLEQKNKEQLEKLKKFAANFKKKSAQCHDLEEQMKKMEATIVDNRAAEELANLRAQVANYDAELVALRHEHSRLELADHQQKAVDDKISIITNLEGQISELESQLQVSQTQRTDLETKLQKAETRLDDLEAELVDTTNEMSRMDKKFTDDLNRVTSEAHSWQSLAQERESQLVEMRAKCDENQKLLNEKSIKFEKSKALIKEKMKEIQRQHALVVDLEARLAETQQQMQVAEGNQQTISIDGQRISGLEMQIEQLEQDNCKLRTQISRLTEGISEMEERRSSLERQKNLLGAKIDEQEREHCANEDELIQRLTSLTKHDEIVERKLQETADENVMLSDKLMDLRHEHDVLKNKNTALQEEIKELETGSSTVVELEMQLTRLQKQLEVAENEARANQQDFDKRLQAKHAEVDDLEAELSSQLQRVEDEKKVLQEELEKMGEKNIELQDEIVRLKEQVHGLEQIRAEWERDLTWMRMQNDNFTHETDDLRVQMLQYQTELDDLKHTNETLQASHEHEVNALKQQLVDMESMNRLAQLSQHQTDDQVILQNENLKLKATLAEKEEEIRQQRSSEIAGLNQRIQSLEHQLGHANQEVQRVQSQLQEVASESLKKDAQLEEQTTLHHAEIRELQHLIAARDAELKSSQQIVVQMQEICETKNDEIGKLRSLTHTPEPAMLITKAKSPVGTLVHQTREDYVHDLEERTRKLNIMHDDYLQQLQEKTRLIDELRREIRHYEQRLDQLESANQRFSVSRDELDDQQKAPQMAPQIASFFTVADPSSVSAFDQQLFGAAPSPFDSWVSGPAVHEQVMVQKSVKTQEVGKPKLQEDTLKTKVDELQQQLQNLQVQHDAALRELNERNARIGDLDKQVFEYQDKVDRLQSAIETIEKTQVLEQTAVKKDAYLCYPEQDHKETQTVEVADSSTPVDPRVVALEAQLREISVRSEQYQNELEQRNNKLDKLNKLVFEYREKIDTLEAKLATTKSQEEPMSAAAFFGGVSTEFDQQIGGTLVKEPDCVTKKPYLCHTDKDTQTSFEEVPPAIVEEAFARQSTASTLSADKPQDHLDLQTRVAELEIQLKAQMAQHAETQKELDRRNKKLEKLNKMVFDYQTKINELETKLERQIVDQPPKTEEQQKIASTFNTAQFFGAATDFDAAFAGREPVSEEWIVPKKVYETFPDEGWGLGSDEAILEEQHHQQSLSMVSDAPRLAISPSVEAELKLREKEDRIAELEQLLAQSDKQSTDLSKKVEKLMKKLKEYKGRLVECEKGFRKSSSVESNELDLAIQEELKQQVVGLETKLKEQKAELEKLQLEKDAIVKRNDVLASANDRMTEMKERQDQQMEMYQSRVKELNGKLEKLESWGDDEPAEKQASVALPTQSEPNKPNPELESQIRDLQVDNEEFQALLEEEKTNNEILETRIRQYQATQVSMQERIDNLEEQLNKSGLARDKLAADVDAKNQEIRDLIAKIDLLSEESGKIRDSLEHLSRENQSLSQEVQQLASEKSELQATSKTAIPEFSTSADPQKLEELEQKVSSLTGQLQYKDAETAQLNQRIQEVLAADQTESLVNEILLKNQEINGLRRQANELSLANMELESNLSLQLTTQMQKVGEGTEGGSTMRKLEKQVADLIAEKAQMEQELQVLNDQVISTLNIEDRMKEAALLLDTKNIEITELKNSLLQVQGRPPSVQDTSAEQRWREYFEDQLAQANAQWSEMVERRGNEVAALWKQHLEAREAEFQQKEQALRKEFESGAQVVTAHTAPVADVQTETTLKTMQAALESQELEIVTLKEQLAIRSAEYARIASQLDPYGKFATSELQKKPTADPKSTAAAASGRAELDLAHYMLHQRDMRCEELTVELISLLEERDSLQLRLSTALRQNEEIKQRAGIYDADISGSSDMSKTTTPEKVAQLPGTEAEAQQTPRSLREQQLRDEREQRYHQMNLLQRDLSNMPPEAMATLMATSDISQTAATSTEGSSSTSMLLNWFLNRTSAPQTVAPTTTYAAQSPQSSSTITHQPHLMSPDQAGRRTPNT